MQTRRRPALPVPLLGSLAVVAGFAVSALLFFSMQYIFSEL
jgi:hypothetical protein